MKTFRETSPAVTLSERAGVTAILIACALNVLVAAGFFYAVRIDPAVSPVSGIFIRILANLVCLVPAFFWGAGLPRIKSLAEGRDLWAWGVLGVLSVATYYYSVTMLGGGQATLLNTGGGVFVVGFAPLLTRQRVPLLHVVGALGCVVGMILISGFAALDFTSGFGCVLAVLSGLLSAVAYLIVARSGTRHSPEAIILHWTIVNLVCIAAVLLVRPCAWPSFNKSWMVLMAVGVCAAWAQYFTAIAYQRARASTVACLSFVAPLLSVVVDLFIFSFPLSSWALAGMATIVICGLIVPLTSL